ncbi:hypothetical protein T492DRAFT_1033032 [Pavlovales sp. CCMP2436]|nr:hypothetical protein T492DRAFT_1033032 [Pavlovales sp. CCMP2436]
MCLVAPLDGYRLAFVSSRHVVVNTCALVESSTCARCGLVGNRRARCALVSSRQWGVFSEPVLGTSLGWPERGLPYAPGGVVAKVQLKVTTVKCRVRRTQAQLTSQAVGETRIDMNLHVDAPRHRASAFESSTCWQVLPHAAKLNCKISIAIISNKISFSRKRFLLDAATF